MSGFSINTDRATVVALTNLTTIGTVLGGTQQQVSTGLRVSGATSDAADFAIAQGIRANLRGQLAVANTQAQAHGLLAVTNAAVTSISDALSQMKTIAVQASSGANTAAQFQYLQNHLNALATQIDTMGQGATYNGTNLLQPPALPGQNIDQIALYADNSAGATVQAGDPISVQFNADLTSFAQNSDPYGATVTLTRTDTLSGGGTATTTVGSQTIPAQSITIGAGAAAVSFSDNIPAGVTSSTYTMSVTSTNGAGTAFSNTQTTSSSHTYSVGQAMGAANTGGTAIMAQSVETVAPLNFVTSTDGSTSLSLNYSNVSSSTLGVSGLNLTSNATGAISAIDAAMTTIGTVAGYYGEQTQTVDNGSTFYQSLTDATTTGLGSLVDANLAEQAAKLQAEQTRQQLSAQMLQIANSQFQVISQIAQNS